MLTPVAAFADVSLVGPSAGFVSIDFEKGSDVRHYEIDTGKAMGIPESFVKAFSQICVVPGITQAMRAERSKMNPLPAIRHCISPTEFLGLANEDGKIILPVIESKENLNLWIHFFD